MAKLVFTALLAAAGLLVPPTTRSIPLVVEVRPATGERAVLRVDGGDSLRIRATAAGLSMEGGRLAEFVAPGTLEITGGEGQLTLRSTDPRTDFVLVVEREVAGVRRAFEARGQRATIRVLGSEVRFEAETMSMREVRAP